MQPPREEVETEIKLTSLEWDDAAAVDSRPNSAALTASQDQSQYAGVCLTPSPAQEQYRSLLGRSCIVLLVLTLCCICSFAQTLNSSLYWAKFLLIPVLIALPSTISAWRSSKNGGEILAGSTVLAWTVIAWVIALMKALQNSPDESSTSKNLWCGARIAVASSLAGLAGWVMASGPLSGFAPITCGAALFTQLALALHWSGTNAGIHQRIWSGQRSRSPVKGWEAFIASFMTAGLLPIATVLAGASALIGNFFNFAGKKFPPSLELALCAAGAAIFIWCVVVFWALFTAVVNYRLTKALDEASMGHARTQEQSFQLTRRLLPGAGFASLCFYAPFAVGGSESVGCVVFWQGIAFLMAYSLTRNLLKKRLPEKRAVETESALQKLLDERA